MSELKCIKVPVVLGLGETQHLICTEIPLKPPAFEIKDVVKRVDVTQCCVGGVVKDEVKEKCIAKVIIDAVLRKNINFKTDEMKRDHRDHHGDHDGDGRKDPDVQGALEAKMLCGDLRHCFVKQRAPSNLPPSATPPRPSAAVDALAPLGPIPSRTGKLRFRLYYDAGPPPCRALHAAGRPREKPGHSGPGHLHPSSGYPPPASAGTVRAQA
ncbi:MAG: hypothetical protein DIU70_001580 [Bacillota bacterium]